MAPVAVRELGGGARLVEQIDGLVGQPLSCRYRAESFAAASIASAVYVTLWNSS